MNATKTYAKLVEISALSSFSVHESELMRFPAQARATKQLIRGAVYRIAYADNPADSEARWNDGDGDVDTAETDQFSALDSTKRVLIDSAVYKVYVPAPLSGLAPVIMQWLIETYDAVTIDSMYRLATDYTKTVAELYHERTNK